MTELFLYDEAVRAEGFKIFCGVDEAGRGPLAGPVFAAAVILPPDVLIEGIDDSKKLSQKKREALFPLITEFAAGYGVASASVMEIEGRNILGATILAMNRAIAALGLPPELALIDGNFCRGIVSPCRALIGGDARSQSVAAASVLAKVSRDRHMLELSKIYPLYGFERHKGYGTKDHYEALAEYGPCPEHRIKFINTFLEKNSHQK